MACTSCWSGNRNSIKYLQFFLPFLCKIQAKEQYGKSYYLLSLLYESNKDIDSRQDQAEKFKKMAFDWSHKNQACEDIYLWCDLGEMYLYGEAVGSDVKLALSWFVKAADHGCADAQFNLGHAYLLGYGVPQDENEAQRWFLLASKQGHVAAKLNFRGTKEP